MSKEQYFLKNNSKERKSIMKACNQVIHATSKKARMYEQIERHGEQLNAIFHTRYSPVALCKKLRVLEIKMHRVAEQWCNGEISNETAEEKHTQALELLDKLLRFRRKGVRVIINGDPRGYALKIDDQSMQEKNLNLYRDWGGYGILAPEFDGKY